jgi:hypothetical protein
VIYYDYYTREGTRELTNTDTLAGLYVERNILQDFGTVLSTFDSDEFPLK